MGRASEERGNKVCENTHPRQKQMRKRETLSRLDVAAHSEPRAKVAVINTPDELENLFVQYGE